MADPNGISRASNLVTTVIATAAAILSVGYVGFQSQNTSSKVTALELKIDELQTKATIQTVALNEIETQFCGQDIVRNLMHANDMRIISLLWKKSFGEPMPTDNAFYPTICNRKAKQ